MSTACSGALALSPAAPLDSVACVLERVPRPDAEPERARPRASAPSVPALLALQAGAGNAAVTRALLQRDWRQYKNERKCKALQNDKEREIYGALRDRGFDESQISAAGEGKANADLVAYDGERLWIVEVKGHNDWLSKDNQELSGNVPLKQLGQKLMGSRRKQIKTSKVIVSVDESLAGAPDEGRGTALTLMVTNLDTDGALLAVAKITGENAQPTYYATTLHEVLKFLTNTLERYEGSYEDDAELVNEHAGAAKVLIADWDKWEGDAASFVTKNAARLELVYTKFRQATAHVQPLANFAKLDAELQVNVALIPVRTTLPRVARRAVLARTRFKSPEDATTWFEQAGLALPREEDEDDDTWIIRLLSADETYGGNDFTPNYELLNKARTQASQPQAPQRQSPKGKKLRIIGGTMWNHIINGVVTIDYVGQKKTPTEKVTGLHTIHGDRPAAEGYGPKTMLGNLGCYRQTVRGRRQTAETGARNAAADTQDKKFQSTFYPDDWSLEDIREAIEYASQRGNTYEVLTPSKGIGMTLWFNGESYYPNYR
jgi:hypothetical protein